MNKRTGGLSKGLATLVAGLAFVACGTTGQTLSQPVAGHNAIVRDPDNPHWAGAATSTVVEDGARMAILRDPDNPYWTKESIEMTAVDYPPAESATRGPR